MKQITSIKQISSNKYQLIINDKKHVVYDDVLLKYHILKKGEITDDVYNEIIKSNNFHEGYNRAIKFISYKMRTEKEVRAKLSKLSVPKKDIEMIIERLYNEGYLNDEKYINAYVNDQINLTLNGPNKILNNLKKEGFNESLIYKYLDYNDDIWKEKAKKVLDKKLKSYNKYSKKMILIKLKNDYHNMGYEESSYLSLINDLNINDENAIIKDYEKVYRKLSSKYEGEKLIFMIKQKLYSLGYNIEQIEKIMSK